MQGLLAKGDKVLVLMTDDHIFGTDRFPATILYLPNDVGDTFRLDAEFPNHHELIVLNPSCKDFIGFSVIREDNGQ